MWGTLVTSHDLLCHEAQEVGKYKDALGMCQTRMESVEKEIFDLCRSEKIRFIGVILKNYRSTS